MFYYKQIKTIKEFVKRKANHWFFFNIFLKLLFNFNNLLNLETFVY